jgi:hypothetical protein
MADMADDKQSGPALGGNSIILLLAAAASAIYVGWRSPPLVSTRPATTDYDINETRTGQDIDTRLWQDPFAAVEGDREAKDKSTGRCALHSIDEFKGRAYDKGESSNTLVLGVTLPGAPYPEDAETRRRLRYAVLAALHTEGYAPDDEQHIGYFLNNREKSDNDANPKAQTSRFMDADLWPIAASGTPQNGRQNTEGTLAAGSAAPLTSGAAGCKAAADATADRRVPRIVPYEWFDRAVPKRHIGILWIDEDELKTSRKRMAALARLCENVKPAAWDKLTFAVVGPQDSRTLAAIAGESPSDTTTYACRPANDATDQDQDHVSPNPMFRMYNFGATVEEASLLKPGQTVAQQLGRWRVAYHRTINDDGKLAAALVKELEHRGFDSSETVPTDPSTGGGATHRDQVVLVSEWDSVYGRDLERSVWSAFAADSRVPEPIFDWVRPVSYLRGLDGRLPNPPSAKKRGSPAEDTDDPNDKSSDSSASATPGTADKFESAEGQSQFDYLRRLAQRIHERDDQLRRGGAHVAAIGVLGRDIYDKLLILQALRPEFPDANFFTTDLDALLLPAKKTHYTRNLLVASSYGLRLRDGLQDDIPPFRNSYQSSIFVASRLAIQDGFSTLPPAQAALAIDHALERGLAQPVLFQIGRTGPQALPTQGPPPKPGANDGGKDSKSPVDFDMFSHLQPDPEPRLVSFWTSLAVFLVPLLLFGFPFCFARVRHVCWAPIGRTRQTWRRPWEWSFGRILAVLILIGMLAAWAGLTFFWQSVALWLTENGTGEPISILEGVSVWPTIALRTFGVVLVLCLIWYTVHDLEVSALETLEKFDLAPDDRSLPNIWKAQRAEMGVWSAFWSIVWLPPLGKAGVLLLDEESRDEMPFEEISGRVYAGRWYLRCARAIIGTLLMLLLSWIIISPIFGGASFDPARGTLARGLFVSITLIEVFTTFFLTFLVVDATLYSCLFIKRLTEVSTKWPDATVQKYKVRLHLKNAKDLADWIDLRFLAVRTRSITRLIYFPFLTLVVLIVSRSSIFDNFPMHWGLLTTQAAILCVVIGVALAYRVTAEHARRVACQHVANRIVAAKGRSDAATAGQLERMLAEMQELREGAFAPWSSQPLVRAVLLPLVTYGGTLLVHAYALPGV